MVGGGQKRDVRRAVRGRREAQVAETERRRLRQLLDRRWRRRRPSAPRRSRPSTRSADRKPISPPARMGASLVGDHLVRRGGQAPKRQIVDARCARGSLGVRRPGDQTEPAPSASSVGPRSGPARRVVCTSIAAACEGGPGRGRESAPPVRTGRPSTCGTGRSSPRVTALIFTAEMVAPDTPNGVIILSRRPPCNFTSVHAARRISRVFSPLRRLCVLVACSPSRGLGARAALSARAAIASSRPPPAPTAPAGPAARAGHAGGTPAASDTSAARRRPRDCAVKACRRPSCTPRIAPSSTRYVDPVDDTQLIKAATDYAAPGPAEPAQPADGDAAAADGRRPTTGNPDKDWQAFGDAYDSRGQQAARLGAASPSRLDGAAQHGRQPARRAHVVHDARRGTPAQRDQLRGHRRAHVAPAGQSAAADRRDLPQQPGHRPAA